MAVRVTTIGVSASGPIFDGTAPKIVALYLEDIKQEVAEHGVNLIHARLGDVLVNPTGFYESQIHTERQVADIAITDTPVIYGPWLEGVGSRNRTTRFKGYHTFRKVTQQLRADAVPIAEEIFYKRGYRDELNGL